MRSSYTTHTRCGPAVMTKRMGSVPSQHCRHQKPCPAEPTREAAPAPDGPEGAQNAAFRRWVGELGRLVGQRKRRLWPTA
jgi:hypothetical protein